MSANHNYLANKIQFIEAENAVMRSMSTTKKFFDFYVLKLASFKNEESCFKYCNDFYHSLFGCYRYESFEHFKKLTTYKTLQSLSAVDRLEYQFLMALFKSKGFDTWVSFKALVLHYYPEITEKRLLQFYSGEAIDAEVLKKVEWVRQIIG